MEIVKRIELWGLNMVFVIGGNGGNAAAHAIAEECMRQKLVCSVVGIPKSIDNDILLVGGRSVYCNCTLSNCCFYVLYRLWVVE